MTQRSVMVVSAVVYAIFGVGFLVAPDLVLGLYGGMSMEPETDHVVGAALIGFAVVNIVARRAGARDARRGIVFGNVAFNALRSSPRCSARCRVARTPWAGCPWR